MYQDKLAQLKMQLQQLKDGTLPDYVKKLKKLDQQYQERLRVVEVWYECEVSNFCVILYVNNIYYFIFVIFTVTRKIY